jgi:hypothetical protein
MTDEQYVAHARRSLQVSIGKPWEALAREYLRVLIARAKRQQELS